MALSASHYSLEELMNRAAVARARAEFPVPSDPETLLNRQDTAAALTSIGYFTSPATLATKATRGGGPPFRKFGRKPLYRWGDSLAWAEARLTPPMRTTSEADAPRTAAVPLPDLAEPARAPHHSPPVPRGHTRLAVADKPGPANDAMPGRT
jgi:hypothetical protein